MATIDLTYGQALRNRRLAVLLSGDVLSKVGDGMLLVADGAARWVVVSAVAVLALRDDLPLRVLGVALLFGSALRLLAASGRRLVATEMGGDRGRFAVNGLLGASDSLALYVIGPALGGALAAAFSPGLVLQLSGFSCLALLSAVLVVVPPARSAACERSDQPTSGWTVLRAVPVAAWLFVVVFAFNLFYMPVEIALPLLVHGPLEGSAAALGPSGPRPRRADVGRPGRPPAPPGVPRPHRARSPRSPPRWWPPQTR